MAGLIFLTSKDPNNQLSRYLFQEEYGQVGFYVLSTSSGSPLIHVYLIDVPGLHQPSWHLDDYFLTDLQLNVLVEKISLRPCLTEATQQRLRNYLLELRLTGPPSQVETVHYLYGLPVSSSCWGLNGTNFVREFWRTEPTMPDFSSNVQSIKPPDSLWLRCFAHFRPHARQAAVQAWLDFSSEQLGPPEVLHLPPRHPVEVELATKKAQESGRARLRHLYGVFLDELMVNNQFKVSLFEDK